eukprot:2517133-Rhodomonas_salina.1
MAVFDTRKIWDTTPQWQSKTFFMRSATGVSAAVPETKALVLPEMTRILLACKPKTGMIDGCMWIFYPCELTAAALTLISFLLSFYAIADPKADKTIKSQMYRLAVGLGGVNLIVCLLAVVNTLPDSWVGFFIGDRSLHTQRSYRRFLVEVILTILASLMVFGAIVGGSVCLTAPNESEEKGRCNSWDRATCQTECYPDYYATCPPPVCVAKARDNFIKLHKDTGSSCDAYQEVLVEASGCFRHQEIESCCNSSFSDQVVTWFDQFPKL